MMKKEEVIMCIKNYLACDGISARDPFCRQYNECKGCPYDEDMSLIELLRNALKHLENMKSNN